jgi:sugar phosphate permease
MRQRRAKSVRWLVRRHRRRYCRRPVQLSDTITRWTGVAPRAQGPAFLTGIGHGGTHWVAGVFYILLPFITRDLGLSYAEAGSLVAVFHGSAFAANFGSGMVVDVTGRRVVFQILSLVMGALALMAFGLTGSFLVLCLLTVLIGASNNLWHPPSIALLSQTYPANRGYALAVHAMGASLGDTVAPVAAGVLIAALGWQATAGWSGIPALAVAALIAWTLLPSDRPQPGAAKRGSGLAEYVQGVRLIVRDRAVLGLCIMAGFRSMTQNGLYVFLPLYLVNEAGFGPVVMGAAMMMLQLGGVVAGPVAGAVSDRIGRRPVVLAGLSVSTVIIVALTFVDNELVYVAGVSLLGFALFAVRPVVHSWMMDLTPPGMAGSATSLMFGTQSLFSVLMPVLGGIVADRFGLTAVFYLLAATVLVSNTLVYLLPRGEVRARA